MALDDLGGKPPELTIPEIEKYLRDVQLGYAVADGRKFARVVRFLLDERAAAKGDLMQANARIVQLEAQLAGGPGQC